MAESRSSVELKKRITGTGTSLHRFLTTTMQTAIITTITAVALTIEAIVIEDATDGTVEDVTFEDDDAVVRDVTDNERTREVDADRMVEESDGIADDRVMEESTDWMVEDDTVKEDEMKCCNVTLLTN